jgi:hypothetical protein
MLYVADTQILVQQLSQNILGGKLGAVFGDILPQIPDTAHV